MNAVEAWRRTALKWNTWFLRRPTGRKGDEVDEQWGKAIGAQKILHIDDEQRAVDYAMGIVARAWGHFGDFQNNMRARHPEDKVKALSAPIANAVPWLWRTDPTGRDRYVPLRLLRRHPEAVGGVVQVRALVTAPPYADYLDEVVAHPLVEGLRLNTVMPLRETHAQVLARLSGMGKPLWVDLKGRQLRVVGAAIPPYTELRLSHPIEVPTPVDAYFSDGRERVRVAAVDGDRLILADGPRRLVGPGESVNIVHPDLRILGTLTETDRLYLAAMPELGLRHVMLSYVEEAADVEVARLLPDVEIVLKIESRRGLAFAHRHGSSLGRLMAARGDLYVEVPRPHEVVGAVRSILAADPAAIVASRLFDSLASFPVPESADIGDVAFLLAIGYRTFLLGDSICFRRDSIISALNLLRAVAGEFA